MTSWVRISSGVKSVKVASNFALNVLTSPGAPIGSMTRPTKLMMTVVPCVSSSFSASGLLIGGQTRQRVIAVNGHAEVRSTMTLTLCGDHAVWDGRAAARMLAAVKSELEGHGSETKRAERRQASRP